MYGKIMAFISPKVVVYVGEEPSRIKLVEWPPPGSEAFKKTGLRDCSPSKENQKRPFSRHRSNIRSPLASLIRLKPAVKLCFG